LKKINTSNSQTAPKIIFIKKPIGFSVPMGFFDVRHFSLTAHISSARGEQ